MSSTLTRSEASAPVPSPKPEADRGFRPDIQGLRAIAVLLVVVYHLYPARLPGGYVGVDVFFVISGFLITSHLTRTLRRDGRVGLVDFWGRRARRLMPAAVVVLTATWLASLVALPSSQLEAAAEQVRASALYFQNWVLARDSVTYLKSDDAASPVQHFWSLSVEEQFYLVWPLLFLVAGAVAWLAVRAGRLPARRRGAVGVGVMLGLAVAVLAVSLWYSATETRDHAAAAYFVTTTRMWELAVGGVLALLPARAFDRLARLGPLAWAGLVLTIVSAFVITGSSAFPGTIALLPVGGAALLIACGRAGGVLSPAPLMSLRPMVFVGDISYSLYLWHWPLIVLWKGWSGGGIGRVDGPVILVASLVLAWLTKVLVEDRVRLAPFIARHRWRSLATVVIAVVPVTLTSVWLATRPAPFDGRLNNAHPGALALVDPSLTVPKAAPVPDLETVKHDFGAYGKGPGGCQSDQPVATETLCRFGTTTNPTRTIALVGDSVAGQWFGSLMAIAKKRHWQVVTDLHSLCPWTTAMGRTPGGSGPYTSCHDWGRNVLRTLTRLKPDLVVTSARPTVGTPDHFKPGPAAFRLIGAGMADYWRQLQKLGIGVVAVHETPEMPQNIPDCLSAPRNTPSDCAEPASTVITKQTPIDVASSLDRDAQVIDLTKYICGPTTCEPVVGNVVVYIDSHHITNTYASTITPYFESALLRNPALK